MIPRLKIANPLQVCVTRSSSAGEKQKQPRRKKYGLLSVDCGRGERTKVVTNHTEMYRLRRVRLLLAFFFFGKMIRK